jgi:hypothetical protein
MSNLILPDANHPDFFPVYHDILNKGKSDGERYNFIVPANNNGLAIPVTDKTLDEYFGDQEYEARQSEIIREEQDLLLVLPGILWDD